MSADLFAEFSKPSESTGQEQRTTLISDVAQPSATTDDDDGWGDFETAEPAPAVITPAAVSKAKQPPLTGNAVSQVAGKKLPLVLDTTRPKAQTKAALASPNVLFDVDDFELQTADIIDDDDDFGDFTSATQPSVTTTTAPSLDLLALEEELAPRRSARQEVTERKPEILSFGALPQLLSSNSSTQKPSSALDLLNDMSDMTSSHLASSSSKPLASSVATGITKTTVEDGDGDWAAWDDQPAPPPSAGPAIVREQSPDGWVWDAEDSGKPLAADSSNKVPPTNVPPPWVILSTFPELFSSGNLLFKPLMSQSASVKQQILMKPKVAQFLHCYILLATTAARVLAGRKYRWQRDKLLAKGMSLSAVGSKGMKLAGVDKTQTAREDREAAEVVGSWREHAGRLRAAVATANSCNEAKLKMPELSDKMQVHTAKMVPTAPSACVICGLKRDERIVKVDFEVEDSFGEWWVDHWGHRACKNFWLEHEPRLRQR
ncbi:hypothetical protein CP533_0807 [Ophiocordyceps camponoti-saundersi (nom. inval.)]|nr:hypothetical protein CP533_0807 [Ophiocordyceps camponoti-saundersi (nom. inval.)]